jgi:hypothetical protein
MSDLSASDVRRIPIVVLGWSVSLTFVVTFVLCILYGLLGFSEGAHSGLLPQILPGFTWLTWPSFFLGVVEVFVYGWYVAVVFGAIYNFVAARFD